MILQYAVLRCTGTAARVFRTRKRTSNTHTITLPPCADVERVGQGTMFMWFVMDGESGNLAQLKRRRRSSAFWERVRCATLFTSSLGHLGCTQSHRMRTGAWSCCTVSRGDAVSPLMRMFLALRIGCAWVRLSCVSCARWSIHRLQTLLCFQTSTAPANSSGSRWLWLHFFFASEGFSVFLWGRVLHLTSQPFVTCLGFRSSCPNHESFRFSEISASR